MPCKACNRKRCSARNSTPEAKARANELRRDRRKTDPQYRAKQTALSNAYRRADVEASRARERETYARLRETIRERVNAKLQDPTERAKVNASIARWRKTPAGRISHQLANTRRKLLLRGVAAKLTKAERLNTLEQHDHRCAYCLTRSDRLTQDHVVALVRGGTHTADNVVPACGSCNSRKSDRPIFLMARYL